ncbi:MAG: hypothetical protein QM747_14775 [Nocardioides sp.]
MNATTRRLHRSLLGLAAAAFGATVTLGAVTPANAVTTYANGTDAKHVQTFDIVTSPEETQDLINANTLQVGYGAFSAGDFLCSGAPHAYAEHFQFVMNSEDCGRALLKCAQKVADGSHPDQVVAVEWHPEFPAMAFGHFECLTELTGQAAYDLILRAIQLATAAG